MKKVIITAGALLLVTAVSFGQKKEIKKAQKALKSGDYTEVMSQLAIAEPLLSEADDSQKALFYEVKGIALSKSANNDLEKMKLAAEAFKMATDASGKVSSSLSDGISELKSNLVNDAIEDQKAERYKLASEKLYASYQISKVDTLYLYVAANNAQNAKEFDTAISYYQTLLDLGYDGSVETYVATDKATGEVKTFPSKRERDIMVQAQQYIKPETKKEASKKADIYKNVASVYIEMGKTDEAKDFLSKAVAENPDDVSILIAQANLAAKLENFEEFNSLMEKVVATDPTNPELYFNLGVGATQIGKLDKAFSYYEKAIELKPDYRDALMNYAIVKLGLEKGIVDEMNSLGTSSADNARYEELKEERTNLFKEVVPYLERAIAVETEVDNTNLMKQLMSLYSQLGEDAKYQALKAKVEGM
ncbi:hypothetical protein SCB49_11017 [unidentified eubacterium SCB49]|nr:hypothetical protein SCB49_11017 [unidentified eubacterium SCB49]